MNAKDTPIITPTEQETETKNEVSQTKVRWDGSKMRTTYANVCNVSSTREEVTMLFGTNQNWHASQKELVIELSDRMILNPYTAKRLSILLSRSMAEYEKLFGEIIVESGS